VIVYGCYDTTLSPALREARRRDIRTTSTEHGLCAVNFEVPDFHQALILAKDQADELQTVIIIGCLDDLKPPTTTEVEGWSAVEWRESWLSLAEEYRVAFRGIGTVPSVAAGASTRNSVIRSFQAAQKALALHLKRQRTVMRRLKDESEKGYAGGRPPFGYRIIDGELTIDPEQAKMVKLVFTSLFKHQHTVATTCKIAKEQFPSQFWDGVKIRRILNHAPLYCSGVYETKSGGSVTLKGAAFLPAEWATAPNPPISRPERSGTMKAPRS